MGDVYVEHRAVFLGGWGPSYNIILLAHTSFALQHMLDICYDEITALDLQFNSSMSVIMRVGPRWDRPCVGFDLGPSRLKFVDSLKYLGIYLKTGKMFSCSMSM